MQTTITNMTTKKAAAMNIAAVAVRGLEIGTVSGGYKISVSPESYPCAIIPRSLGRQEQVVKMSAEFFAAEVQNDWNLFHGSNRATGLQGRLRH